MWIDFKIQPWKFDIASWGGCHCHAPRNLVNPFARVTSYKPMTWEEIRKGQKWRSIKELVREMRRPKNLKAS